MADGDANAGTEAAAAGLDVMTGIEELNTVHRFINSTRDMIARFGVAVRSIATGGTGATNATDALTNLGAYSKAQVDAKTWPASQVIGAVSVDGHTNNVHFAWAPPNLNLFVDATLIAQIPNGTGQVRGISNGDFGAVPLRSAGSRNTQVSSGYVVAYLNSDGTLGYAPSLRELKNVHGDYTVPDNWDQLTPVVFDFKDDPQHTAHIGLIAEDATAVEPGLGFTDADGNLQGIDYAQSLPVMLLAIVKQQEQHLNQLEQRIGELEQNGAAQ